MLILNRVSCYALLLLLGGIFCPAAIAQAIRGLEPIPQDRAALDETWRWRSFPELKGKGLVCLDQGPGDSMWFGIDGGAMGYDGLLWTEYGQDRGLDSAVIAFAVVPDAFFAATSTSVYRFATGQWKRVFPRDSPQSWLIEDLTKDSAGDLWAATNWGALRLATSESAARPKATLFAAPQVATYFRHHGNDVVSPVQMDTLDETEWKAGAGLFLYAPVPGGQSIIEVAAGSPAARAGLVVGDLIVALNGEDRQSVFQNELEGPPGKTLRLSVRRPGESRDLNVEFSTEEIAGAASVFRPYRIVQGPDGTMWFATRLGHLLSLRKDSAGKLVWQNHSRDFGLPDLPVPCLAATATGIAVAARSTSTHSLLQFDGSEWQDTRLSLGISSSIAQLRDRTLLVGCNGQLLIVDENGESARSVAQLGIVDNDLLVRQTTDGAVWLAGRGGSLVLRLEPQGNVWTTFQGLLHQGMQPDGTNWFLSQSMQAVRHNEAGTRTYGTADGLMSVPLSLLVTRSGIIWAAGSDEGVAATAVLRGDRWEKHLHPELSWAIDRRAVLEDREGRMWFGAAGMNQGDGKMRGGVVRFDGSRWKHFLPTNRLNFVYGMCQTKDGSVWCAGAAPVRIAPGDQIASIQELPRKAHGFCDAIAADLAGRLWLGTRTFGVMEAPDGSAAGLKQAIWHDESSGVDSNRVRSLLPLHDGTVMVSTFASCERYDGRTWTPTAIPDALVTLMDYNGTHQAADGSIWLNHNGLQLMTQEVASGQEPNLSDPARFRTYRYAPDLHAPDTQLDAIPTEVSLHERAVFSWQGSDLWNGTASDELQYSWRVDDTDWSPFASETLTRISDLATGHHRLEVRARDLDFNVDPSPATVTFYVTPPLWQRTWLQSLILLVLSSMAIVGVQTLRVFRREASLRIALDQVQQAEQKLQKANAGLEVRVDQRTRELRRSNEQLQQEIAERIVAEDQLYESEIRYRSIVEDQTEYIVRLTASAEIEFVNQAFLRAAVGEALVRMPSTPPASVLPLAVIERIRLSVSGLSPQAPLCCQIIRFETDTGDSCWEEWQSRLIMDDNGIVMGYQSIGRDVTELRLTERRLEQKERQLAHVARVSALGEMVAGISHEISQPLAAIANFSSVTQLILEKEPHEATQLQQLNDLSQQIQQQTERIRDIVKGLHRFARPGSTMQTFQISEVVSESLLLTESRTRSTVDHLVADCSERLPPITADRIQIEQVLVNLIRNACDALEDITDHERRLSIQATEEAGFIVVTVTDSGPGVAPELREHVFDAFVTSKADGMGIGLSISRSIIESHGGELSMISDGACGKFRFRLPTTAHSEIVQDSDPGTSGSA